jgi:hypothetical protein
MARPTLHDAVTVAKAVQKHVQDRHDKQYLPTVEGLAVHLEVSWGDT